MSNTNVSRQGLFQSACIAAGLPTLAIHYTGIQPDRRIDIQIPIEPETGKLQSVESFEVPDGFRIKQIFLSESEEDQTEDTVTLSVDLVSIEKLVSALNRTPADHGRPFPKDWHQGRSVHSLLARALELLGRPKMVAVDVLTDLTYDVVFEFRNGMMHLADKSFKLDEGFFVSSVEFLHYFPMTLRINLCRNSEHVAHASKELNLAKSLPSRFRTQDAVTNGAISQILRDWECTEEQEEGTIQLGCRWIGHLEYDTPIAAFNSCVLTDIQMHESEEGTETDDRRFTLMLKYVP